MLIIIIIIIIKYEVSKIFESILCRIDKCNLFLRANVLLFDVLFMFFFSILSQKGNFISKGKTTLIQVI